MIVPQRRPSRGPELVLPHRYLMDIEEFLDALNAIMPGVNQNDTLLMELDRFTPCVSNSGKASESR